MKIIISTSNEDKIREINEICKDFPFKLVTLKNWAKENKTSLPQIVEDGSTFEENSFIKAKAAFSITNLPSLADDSGLVVPSLNGEPGLYSARYALENIDNKNLTAQEIYDLNRIKLLSKLSGYKNREAYFICCVVLIVSQSQVFKSTGKCFGKIALECSDTEGFGYDPIFLSTDKNIPFSKLPAKEKNRVSHRGIALRSIFHSLHLQKPYDNKL